MAIFNDLPAELRARIWEQCLPDPETPEIYFFDRSDFDFEPDASDTSDASQNSASEWEAEREVLIGFPIIMHLCRESRRYAQNHLSFREEALTPTRTLDLPCRSYRPATDVFFVRDFQDFARLAIAAMNAAGAAQTAQTPVPKVFSQEIAHLAVDAALFTTDARSRWSTIFRR